MGLVIVNSGRNGVSESNSFFLNYGSNNLSYGSQHFSFPADGYIKYISISGRGNSPINSTFSLLNDTIPQTYTDVITLGAGENVAYEKFTSSDIVFSAGDRFRFRNDSSYENNSTNVTFFAELPSLSGNLISVIGSMASNITIPKTTFTAGNQPYSFGFQALRNTANAKTSIGFRVPFTCQLIGATLSLPGAQAADVTLNIQQNGSNIETLTALTGDTVGIGSYAVNFLTGDRVTLECATTNPLNYSTVLLIFNAFNV